MGAALLLVAFPLNIFGSLETHQEVTLKALLVLRDLAESYFHKVLDFKSLSFLGPPCLTDIPKLIPVLQIAAILQPKAEE